MNRRVDGLRLALPIVSDSILLSSANAGKLNLHATGSTARVRAFRATSEFQEVVRDLFAPLCLLWLGFLFQDEFFDDVFIISGVDVDQEVGEGGAASLSL